MFRRLNPLFADFIFGLLLASILGLSVFTALHLLADSFPRHVITVGAIEPNPARVGESIFYTYTTTRSEPSECEARRFIAKDDAARTVVWEGINICSFGLVGTGVAGRTHIQYILTTPGNYIHRVTIIDRYRDGRTEIAALPEVKFVVIP